jgi:hypothetical protein
MARGLVRHALLPGGTGVASLNGSYTTPAAEDHSYQPILATPRSPPAIPVPPPNIQICIAVLWSVQLPKTRRRLLARQTPTAVSPSDRCGRFHRFRAGQIPGRDRGARRWGFHRFRAGQIPGPRPRHRPVGIPPLQGRSNPRPTASAPASGDFTVSGPVKSPDRGLGTGQWGFHRARAGRASSPSRTSSPRSPWRCRPADAP